LADYFAIFALSSPIILNAILRVTPAMEAGIADNVWRFEEIIELVKH